VSFVTSKSDPTPMASFRRSWLRHWRRFGPRYAVMISVTVAAMVGLLTWWSAQTPQLSVGEADGWEFVGREVVVTGSLKSGPTSDDQIVLSDDGYQIRCTLLPNEACRVSRLPNGGVVRVRGTLTRPGELHQRVID
jgi:hypothetical protein